MLRQHQVGPDFAAGVVRRHHTPLGVLTNVLVTSEQGFVRDDRAGEKVVFLVQSAHARNREFPTVSTNEMLNLSLSQGLCAAKMFITCLGL